MPRSTRTQHRPHRSWSPIHQHPVLTKTPVLHLQSSASASAVKLSIPLDTAPPLPCCWLKKLKMCIADSQSLTAIYGTSLAILDHTVFTCHPTQVNAPALTPTSKLYSIYLPQRDGRLNWPRLAGNATAGVELPTSRSQVRRPIHYTSEPPLVLVYGTIYRRTLDVTSSPSLLRPTFKHRLKCTYFTFPIPV